MKKNKNRFLLIISMVIFGTIGLFTRYIDIPSKELALYRAVLATLFLGFYLIISKRKIDFKAIKNQIPLLLLSGIALAFNWIFLFESYKYTAISVATLSYYMAPVIVTVASSVIFKEKLSLLKIICFVMSALGMVFIIDPQNIISGDVNPKGVLLGLLAAVFYSTVIILNKYIKNVDSIERNLLQFIAVIIILTPYVLLTDGIHLAALNGKGTVSLLILGLIHTGFTYCIYFKSISALPGQETAVLSYIDPLVAVVISFLVFKETMTLSQIIGGVLILGFTLLNELPVKKTVMAEKS
ncbi:MAG: DMT family transporter [Acutalibacteraceae bacterium]